MNRTTGTALVLVLLASCGGPGGSDAGTNGSGDGGSQVDAGSDACSGPDGTACGAAGHICVSGACVEKRCGDRYVDTAGGEECDDGNETAFDGCEPDTCTFTCTEASQCDDGEACNGAETCNTGSHVCEFGSPLTPGSPCTRVGGDPGVCRGTERAAMCIPAGCGNGIVDGTEQCDDMNDVTGDGCELDCTYSCTAETAAADCDDGTVCTTDACGADHACANTAIDCSPSDACHTATCDPSGGCTAALIDPDGDGYAAEALGPCGADCNGTDPAIHPGATEVCDGVDQNCDHVADTDIMPTWYVDCDGDGYAATDTSSRAACSSPDPSAAGCVSGGGWTMLRPTGASSTDCDDANPGKNPGLAEVPGDAGNVDEDCSGGIQCYANSDGDAARTNTVVNSPDGNCDGATEAYAARASGDCCDVDNRVYPGATTCYPGTTACGGYDYNCAGGDQTCLNTITSGFCTLSSTTCTGVTPGWLTAAPGCGGSGTYVSGCSRVRVCDPTCFWDCVENVDSAYAQTCR